MTNNSMTNISNNLQSMSLHQLDLMEIGLEAMLAGKDPFEAARACMTEEEFSRRMAAVNQ